jgi:hypothetical protein
MRKLSVFLGVLLMPALAMAQNLNVVNGTYAQADAAGASSLYDSGGVTIPSGSQWEIWTVIDTPIDLDGMQWALHANGGADDGKFDIVGYADGPLHAEVPIDNYKGFGSAFSSIFVPDGTKFGSGDLTKGVTPFGLGTTELLFAQTGFKAAASIDGKSLVGYILQNNVDLTSGTYDISVNGPIQGAGTALWISTPLNGELTGSAFTIAVPEPTSALLLLAAVPFLRRRRA